MNNNLPSNWIITKLHIYFKKIKNLWLLYDAIYNEGIMKKFRLHQNLSDNLNVSPL